GSAVAIASLEVLEDERLDERAEDLGSYFMDRIRQISSGKIKEVRGRGLLVAVELHPEAGDARHYCNLLKERGILAKDTHGQTIRFAPALVIDREELDWAVDQIRLVLEV
ncbi:MAG TPA: aminotransferase class III-fold pyridoxal phosphate-dependent enzyme, partial [Euryarchaeota archaeon]|nr:aminotransferase class III-fold pyridoxal phosphate-dependent enzyme [Euryarchaeota archaeon]